MPAAEAGSQKTPFFLGQHLLGGQDLPVRNALYEATGLARGREGPLLARG